MVNKRLLQIFLEVIEIEGLSQNEAAMAHYIKKFVSGLGRSIIEDESTKKTGSNTGNLIIHFGSKINTLFLSHMDTARSTLGVRPIVHDDRVTSDGSTVLGVDNRAGVAVLLFLIENIALAKIPAPNLTIAFTTCEETSLEGSKNLGVNGNVKYGYVFDSYLRPGHIINEAFGAAGFKIIVNGKSSHAGISPEKGINAIKIAGTAIAKLEMGRIDGDTTINIGNINGGTGTNVIPDRVELNGEVRSISTEKVKTVLTKIENHFSEIAGEYGTTISMDYRWEFEPYIVSPHSHTFKVAARSMEKLNLQIVPAKSWGGSDANSLNARGIESINLGIGAQNPHSNEEYIFLEDLQNTYNIAEQISMGLI